ncbi:MAG: hypothetical protein AAGK97_05890, partial [Bacteroidota bacterium]
FSLYKCGGYLPVVWYKGRKRFIALEIEEGNIQAYQFSEDKKHIYYHGHCYQKAIGKIEASLLCLALPKNYIVSNIPSGCCGMAGSFGYEKEHYELSNKIAEQSLFPALRKRSKDSIISASGTSCRHQIKDGLGLAALHPIEILYDALK